MKKIKDSILNLLKNKSFVLGIIVYFIVIFPFLLATKYSVPQADDFSFQLSLREYTAKYGSEILAAIHFNIDMLNTVQGTYFSNWTPMYFSAFMRGGIRLYHIELFIENVLFMISIYAVARSIAKTLSKNISEADGAILASILAAMFMYRVNASQTLYWMCGGLVYILPITLGAFACCFVLNGYTNKDKWFYVRLVLASICAFLGSGGTLTVSAGLCGWMVLLIGIKWLDTKKFDLTLIPAALAWLGAVLNAIAPGNFVRQGEEGVMDASVSVALHNSLEYIIEKYYSYIQNGLIVVIIIALGLIFWNKIDVEKHSFKLPGLVTVWMLIVSFLGIFPVMYGHKRYFVALRSEHVETIIVAISIVTIVLYWMGWTKKKFNLKFSKEMAAVFVVGLFAALSLYFSNYTTDDFYNVKIMRNYQQGNLQHFFNTTMDMLYQVENSESPNVVIEFYEPDNMEIYDDMHLEGDPYCWINDAIAKYYGQETMSVIYCDPADRE